MAKIGTFGDLTFSVSDQTVRTFDGMNWNFSGKYATHDRHIEADLIEYLGPEIETISFEMIFSVFLGVNPYNEIKKLRQIVKDGRAERLVLGAQVYGDYKWVMEKGTIDLQKFDKQGNLWEAKAKVTLKEYPKR